jgi:hypothetical protein
MTNAVLPQSSSPRWSSLGVYVTDNREQLSMSAEYLEERFPDVAIREMLQDLRQTVMTLVNSPEERIFKLPRISESRSKPRGPHDSRMSEFLVIGGDSLPSARPRAEIEKHV